VTANQRFAMYVERVYRTLNAAADRRDPKRLRATREVRAFDAAANSMSKLYFELVGRFPGDPEPPRSPD